MSALRALVVIPQTVNFFNNIAGRRLRDALVNLGWNVELTTLAAYRDQPADVVFLVSLLELFVNCGDRATGKSQLARIRENCRKVVMWLLEPVRTPWFANTYDLMVECGLETLVDNALHDQSEELTPEQRPRYHHLFYGLTEMEKQQAKGVVVDDRERVIPWTFVGYRCPERIDLARFLVSEVDPSGLFYLTDVTPITEHGPHLKDAAFQRVLKKSRYQLWRAHHSSFYMEGERYRRSALAGCVPIKIVVEDDPGDRILPFRSLVVRPDELIERLQPDAYPKLRSEFIEEYCNRPSLEDELRRFLQPSHGVGLRSAA